MDDRRTSKLLSLVLRHDPGRIGISLDRSGWVPIEALLTALELHGARLTRSELERIVATNDKQRFAIDPVTDRIRANQGHTVEIDLGLPPRVPPTRLFHGTAEHRVEAILREGLRAQGRHAVHLSADERTAHQVGSRHGRAHVLVVDSGRMHEDGHQFSRSDNGVWLVKQVPPAYLSTTAGARSHQVGSSTSMSPSLPDPGPSYDVKALFLQYLDFYRGAAARKIAGLDEEALRRPCAPSGWSPLELVNHLAHMERRWLVWGFLAEDVTDPWGDHADGRWHVADGDTSTTVLTRLEEGGARTRRIVEAAELSAPARLGGRFTAENTGQAAGPPGPPTLVAILFHVLQEYARHVGHLDLARELIDGHTGE